MEPHCKAHVLKVFLVAQHFLILCDPDIYCLSMHKERQVRRLTHKEREKKKRKTRNLKRWPTCHVAGHVVPTRGCWWSSGHRTHRGGASRHRSAQSCWWETQGPLGNKSSWTYLVLYSQEINIAHVNAHQSQQSEDSKCVLSVDFSNILVWNLLSPSVSNRYQ